jgi:hypothetical protein
VSESGLAGHGFLAAIHASVFEEYGMS